MVDVFPSEEAMKAWPYTHAPSQMVGTKWVWEPYKPHARAEVTIGLVWWNDEEWWLHLRDSDGKSWPNTLERFMEATILAEKPESSGEKQDLINTQALSFLGQFPAWVDRVTGIVWVHMSGSFFKLDQNVKKAVDRVDGSTGIPMPVRTDSESSDEDQVDAPQSEGGEMGVLSAPGGKIPLAGSEPHAQLPFACKAYGASEDRRCGYCELSFELGQTPQWMSDHLDLHLRAPENRSQVGKNTTHFTMTRDKLVQNVPVSTNPMSLMDLLLRTVSEIGVDEAKKLLYSYVDDHEKHEVMFPNCTGRLIV